MEIEFDNEDPKDKELFNEKPSEGKLKENENEN